MLKRLVLPLALVLLNLTACSQTATPAPTPDPLTADSRPKLVDLTASDNTPLKATYYPPARAGSGVPAILLLHMLNSNRQTWQNFATLLQEAGYVALALDLRGHGESGGSQNFAAMDTDVTTALQWLAGRPEIDGGRLGIVGAGIGANLALRGGANNDQVKSVVLLSPGLDYQGLTTVDALDKYGRRAVMLVASERDVNSADAARTLNRQALGQHQLQIYPGAEHGTNILQAQAGLTPMLLAWFASTL